MAEATSAKRGRKPHPGVRILELATRSGRRIHQARFTSPETGKLVCQSLDALGLTTAEARRAWAIQKSKGIQQRRFELRDDVGAFEDARIKDAIDRYLATCRASLRERTVRAYSDSLHHFTSWTERMGITRTSQITRRVLARFREYLMSLPNGRAVRGGKRGARASTGIPRSPRTINRDQDALRTAMNYLARCDLLPSLNRHRINDVLRDVEQPQPAPKFLSFASAHDGAVFKMTRLERNGRLVPGRMPRHLAIAPITLLLMFAGMRRGEALALRWEDVDLDARDEHGNISGELRIQAASTKTKSGRMVDLSVSPVLRRLLLELRARSSGEGLVFEGLSEDILVTTQRRLIRAYGAPKFCWQELRSTCATVLTNAPAIFGSAAVFRSARQLGHGVQVAERHYLKVLRGIPATARSVEAAMQVEELAERVVEMVGREERGAIGVA
jgi:integrase